MLFLEECQDHSGKAADTGSAVHKAVAAFHRGADYQEAVEAMRASVQEYPLADMHEAELHFRPYSQDPRNQEAECVLIEEPVRLVLEAPAYPTQEAIVIKGTLDQVRRELDGRLTVHDLKTGKAHSGWDMMQIHAPQLAAYTLAASERLNEPCYPGSIIRSYGYRVRGAELPSPSGVFCEIAWGIEECKLLMFSVCRIVELLRAGKPFVGPGSHCGYCPAGGLESCLPRLRSLL